MLGDVIAEEQAQIIAQRVLPGEHGLSPTVETSFRGTGELLGVAISDMGSYTGRMRADGTLYGHGQGVIMGAGGAHATYVGHGVGQFTESGGISWRGTVIYESDFPGFAALRGVAGVFEWEQDESGKITGKLWAWK